MDECLNNDDDEEHHRVFFTCSGAQHERFSLHAGNEFRRSGRDPIQILPGELHGCNHAGTIPCLDRQRQTAGRPDDEQQKERACAGIGHGSSREYDNDPASAVHPPEHEAQEKLIPEETAEFHKANGHRETGLLRDSLHILERDGIWHVISEDYSYKTEPYYTILDYELRGKNVRPASSAVLDAYVVPMCLERAKLAGIPVAEWGISQGFVPLPAIIYGLNYFATSADFFLVRDGEKAKEVIAHVTNKGKYPFCYQKIPPDATVHSCVSIFGRTADSCAAIAGLAEKIYRALLHPARDHGLCQDREMNTTSPRCPRQNTRGSPMTSGRSSPRTLPTRSSYEQARHLR